MAAAHDGLFCSGHQGCDWLRATCAWSPDLLADAPLALRLAPTATAAPSLGTGGNFRARYNLFCSFPKDFIFLAIVLKSYTVLVSSSFTTCSIPSIPQFTFCSLSQFTFILSLIKLYYFVYFQYILKA